MKISCPHCGNEVDKPVGEVNRAKKVGAPLYCGKICSGLARRTYKTTAQKKEEKRLYDIKYRERMLDEIKRKKRAHHVRTYDPASAAVVRRRRSAQHAEYCRRPEYREWKSGYDRQYRAKKNYGEFWECFLLSMEIREEALIRSTDYEIRLEKERATLCQRRKRWHARSYREKLEIGPLGDIKSGQRR